MSTEAIISLCALLVSFASLLFVYIQLRYFTRQLRLGSRIELSQINREILALGFSDPTLFEVLKGQPISSEKERRFLQLWLNQVDVIWHSRKFGLLEQEEWLSFRSDIADLMRLDSMQAHWQKARMYYSPQFRAFIDELVTTGKQVKIVPDKG